MREFSLVASSGTDIPGVPYGAPILVYGNFSNAMAYSNYDGKMDRDCPESTTGEWFPLGVDRDSIMAWHGERKVVNRVYYGRVLWSKE